MEPGRHYFLAAGADCDDVPPSEAIGWDQTVSRRTSSDVANDDGLGLVSGIAPLALAAGRGDTELVGWLLDGGANPDGALVSMARSPSLE